MRECVRMCVLVVVVAHVSSGVVVCEEEGLQCDLTETRSGQEHGVIGTN